MSFNPVRLPPAILRGGLLATMALLLASGCNGMLVGEPDDADGSLPVGRDGSVVVDVDAGGPDCVEGPPPAIETAPPPEAPEPDALPTGDFYVNEQGDDANDGLTRETAFATIQAGVDALGPGDTLVIGPGEYFENVRRVGLGDGSATTTIMAEIPGTVVLRGDIPAPSFRPVEGTRFLYEADFTETHPETGEIYEIQTINELDTWSVLEGVPSRSEPEFVPGVFVQDADAGKIYLSTTDMRPATAHRYSLSVIHDPELAADPERGNHGLYLGEATQVVVDGITARGFNTNEEVDYRDRTGNAVWGIWLANSTDCVIRNSYAFLNGRGMGSWSQADEAGGNVIEHAAAWANTSQYSSGDSGGLTLFHAQRDIIRDSVSFLNGSYGANFRLGEGTQSTHQSFIRRVLAWGNGAWDYRNKAHVQFHEVQSSVGMTSVEDIEPVHHLSWDRLVDAGGDSISLSEEEGLDVHREFADPDNHDYRLQDGSRFIGSGPGGVDRGPFPYEADVFFVAPSGDDGNSGLSVDAAWATLAHAAENLRAGDTLYILPGAYAGDAVISAGGTPEEAIAIRGRGHDPVVLEGDVRFSGASHLNLERITFARDVLVESAESLSFHNSRFLGDGAALTARSSAHVEVTQSVFTGFATAGVTFESTSAVHLAGNLYDNDGAPAVRVDAAGAVRHSDYNSYGDACTCWEVGGNTVTLANVQAELPGREVSSRYIVPDFDRSGSVPVLSNEVEFAGGGSLGRPFGTYRFEARGDGLEVNDGPLVHSVSATTANIEWFTSLPATVEIAWGENPDDLRNTDRFDAPQFGTYSLTGLSPNTTYHFEIRSLEIPHEGLNLDAEPVTVDGATLSFTTAASDPAPRTYYVSTDGSDGNDGSMASPWRTIQRAANEVAVGDTVMIGEGTYSESVRIRATGTPGAPITFRNVPGERVVLDGANGALNQGFIVGKKSHLRFDGFFIRRFNLQPGSTIGWLPEMGSNFNIYRGEDIRITRVMHDGREAIPNARSLVAWESTGIVLENVVDLRLFSSVYCNDCANFRMENCVSLRPSIKAFLMRSGRGEAKIFRNNIYTDNLRVKAEGNIPILLADGGGGEGLQMTNNVYFLRDVIPLSSRNLYGGSTLSEAVSSGVIQDPLTVDPRFLGVQRVADSGDSVSGYPPDTLTRAALDLAFDDFFARHPDVVSAGIGLDESCFDGNGLPSDSCY